MEGVMKFIVYVALGILLAFLFLVNPIFVIVICVIIAVIGMLVAMIRAIAEEPARHRAEEALAAAERERKAVHAALARSIGAKEEPPEGGVSRTAAWVFGTLMVVLCICALCAL